MALISQKTLKQLFEWNKSFWKEVSANPNVPQTVKSMVYQHLQTAWVPGALAVVISPLANGQDPFLKNSAFDLGGIQYYYPSLDFWKAHASTSHPPDGSGCNPEAHAEFLTRDGSNPEFIYSVVRRDGSIKVQDLAAFVDECAFFDSGTNE